MQKLHFLFLLAGGLMILGCEPPVDRGEGQADPTLTVTASPSNGGTVARSPDQTPPYAPGTVVTLTASPATGFEEFARWEGDATGSDNPTTITMNGDKTVKAVFTPATTPLIRLSTSSWKFLVSVVEPGPYFSTQSGIGSRSTAIHITNGGIDTLSGLDYSFPDGTPTWLSAKLSGSTAPATLTVTLAWQEMEMEEQWSSHSYPSTRIAISSAAARNSPQYVRVAVIYFSGPFPSGGFTWRPSGPPSNVKVICAELHRQGLMDETIYRADEAFGTYLRDNHRDVLLGYHLWAKPVVRWMQKSKAVTKIVASVATPWSYEMAYRMGARAEGTFGGKILMDVGVPVCRTIGRAATWVNGLR